MKGIKYAPSVIAFILLCAGMHGADSSPYPADENEKTACNVLRRLSEGSGNWPEVVAYKNAFGFVMSHIRDRNGLADDERYFRRLAERNHGILVCMYVDKEPKKDCGFRNMETHSLLEAIEEKMKKDHLSTDDILKAIESARPEDPGKFKRLIKPDK
jgi:hypothetical protein